MVGPLRFLENDHSGSRSRLRNDSQIKVTNKLEGTGHPFQRTGVPAQGLALDGFSRRVLGPVAGSVTGKRGSIRIPVGGGWVVSLRNLGRGGQIGARAGG